MMVDKGNVASGSLDLNELAASLEDAFRVWARLDQLASRPQFVWRPAGADRGLPRFGVAQLEGSNSVTIDPALDDVAVPIVLREIVRGYFPPHCLVDITHDIINRFCGPFLASVPTASAGAYNAPRWQALVKAHSRLYVVHYLGSPITLDLDALSRDVIIFFPLFLAKLRQCALLIPPGQTDDIIAIIVQFISNSLLEHGYSLEDVEFDALLSDYMGTHLAFPTPGRLAGGRPGWTRQRCEAAARRFKEGAVSPTYFPNPGALGLIFCWILVETPPAVSNYIVRHLMFIPFGSQSFTQCSDAPLPTYLGLYFLAPTQLDEFGGHLADLKLKGVLLDYQIFRAEQSLDVINWNECLAVPPPQAHAPEISQIGLDWGSSAPGPAGLAGSWFVQQIIPYLAVRKHVPWAMTHLDLARNYQSFLAIIHDAAFLFTANLEKDLAVVIPLLDRYRCVQYVIHLLDLGIALLRHLFAHPGAASQGDQAFGKLGLAWKLFPAREWLLGHFRSSAGDGARQTGILDTLALANHTLGFFVPVTIPPGTPAGVYLREKQHALAQVIKVELARVPAGEKERLRYFTDLLDQVVVDHMIDPRLSISILFHSSTEDFYFFARSARPWDDLAASVACRLASLAHHIMFLQFRDQVGAPVIGGVIRATHTQFRSFRRALVGVDGVLGLDASILIGRRVPFWDMIRRHFIETFDVTAQKYAPIGEYLALMRAEHLAGWVRPRNPLMPYARKILSESYLGPAEQTPRPPPNVVKLTPKIVAGLKESFLSGTPALHHLVGRRLGVRWSCDLNWPAYGLERYFLHVFLSTRNPKYILSHLVTPATRRVLASAAVSGFQTVILEYLWPKGAPDDKFLQYLYSRTEKNVLAYSVHRVLADTRFFNLDKVQGQGKAGGSDEHAWDNIDLLILMLARAQDSGWSHMSEFRYEGDSRHTPGSAGWEMAASYLASATGDLPPDGHPQFEFDPRTIGFSEKTALFFRGDFDALPLCQALPFGHYYRTEEIYYSSTERLVGQPGRVILFDFPSLRMSQLDAFLDDFLRGPAMTAHSVASFLTEQNLTLVQGVALARVNPLRANPYDFAGGHYIHLPKRQLREGKWHTLSLKDQAVQLHQAWTSPSP